MSGEILFYDGVCALCHRVVQFVLDHDRDRHFRFAALQSALARETLARHGRRSDDLDTLYVVIAPGEPGERLLSKGRAALHVLRRIGGVWRILTVFGVLPTFVLDAAYDVVAATRYRLFGRHDTCRLPSADDRERIIE